MNSRIIPFIAALLVFFSSACTVINQRPSPALKRDAVWAILPIVNHTETPQAGLRAEAITEALLRNRGINLRRYPASISSEALFDATERKLLAEALAWARSQGAQYAVTGAVEEWRYKVGIDGEPAVGVTLQVTDVQTNDILWTSTGGKTGWSREALSGVAQKLLTKMVGGIQLD